MDVRAENHGHPHRETLFDPWYPGVSLRNVRRKSRPQRLCLCCFLRRALRMFVNKSWCFWSGGAWSLSPKFDYAITPFSHSLTKRQVGKWGSHEKKGARQEAASEQTCAPGANPQVAERAPWRCSQSGVARARNLDFYHFPCAFDTLVRPQDSNRTEGSFSY